MQFIVGFGSVDNIRDWSISSLKEGDKRGGGGLEECNCNFPAS